MTNEIRQGGELCIVPIIIEMGRPKDDFLQSNNVYSESQPAHWLGSFIPNERGIVLRCPSALTSEHLLPTKRKCFLIPGNLIINTLNLNNEQPER